MTNRDQMLWMWIGFALALILVTLPDRFLKFGSHLFLTGTQRVIAKTIESQPEGKVAIRINVVQSRCNRSVIK
jgi:hypothetical protein